MTMASFHSNKDVRAKVARNRRAFAMERNEFRQASTPRASAAGTTSFAVKAADPETERLIREFIGRQHGSR